MHSHVEARTARRLSSGNRHFLAGFALEIVVIDGGHNICLALTFGQSGLGKTVCLYRINPVQAIETFLIDGVIGNIRLTPPLPGKLDLPLNDIARESFRFLGLRLCLYTDCLGKITQQLVFVLRSYFIFVCMSVFKFLIFVTGLALHSRDPGKSVFEPVPRKI